jgi:predicted transcriptional regulator
MTETASTPHRSRGEWTFLTNHTHVLICVQEDPSIRTRDIAVRVGITERAVQRIISDLCEAEYLTRKREGRRNHYAVHAEKPLRHPVEARCFLSGLLKTVEESEGAGG